MVPQTSSPDTAQAAGGKTEQLSRERDAEQRNAGYPAESWIRRPVHNVRSEPHWDPSEGSPFLRTVQHLQEDVAGKPRWRRRLEDAGLSLVGRIRRMIRKPEG